MKTFKRVLVCTLSFIIIFTILCTSVFAVSPSFPFPDGLTNKYLYSPTSNLQSIVVPGGSYSNPVFYSLSSPYSLVYESPWNGWVIDSSLSSDYYIGNIKDNAGNESPYLINNKLFYRSGGAGPYVESVVSIVHNTYYPFDYTFKYGATEPELVTAVFVPYNGITDCPYLKV